MLNKLKNTGVEYYRNNWKDEESFADASIRVIDELKSEIAQLNKTIKYSEKVAYQTSIDNTKLISEISQLKENIVETLWNHYKENGGYTRTASELIKKITGEKWEREKENQELKEQHKKAIELLQKAEYRFTFLVNNNIITETIEIEEIKSFLKQK